MESRVEYDFAGASVHHSLSLWEGYSTHDSIDIHNPGPPVLQYGRHTQPQPYSQPGPRVHGPRVTSALSHGGLGSPAAFVRAVNCHVESKLMHERHGKFHSPVSSTHNSTTRVYEYNALSRLGVPYNRHSELCEDAYFCEAGEQCPKVHTFDELTYFRGPLAKTKMCTRNLGSICDQIPSLCNYAHSSRDARCERCHERGHFVGDCPLCKFKPCRRLKSGVCSRDPLYCAFAHSPADARCLTCHQRGHFSDHCPHA